MIKLFFATVLLLSANAISAASWTHAVVDIVESYEDNILIRWNGAKTENCSSNAVKLAVYRFGTEEAFDRAFKLSLTAAVSGKPIRFKLNGCNGNYQNAEVVQLCATQNCTYH